MHHESSTMNNVPNLYTGSLVTQYLAMPDKSVRDAISREHLRAWGKISVPKGQGVNRGVWLVTAQQLAQWLISRQSAQRIAVSSELLDTMLKNYCETLKQYGALPKAQAYIERTPYEDLIWLSNYAHHRSKTKRS